MAHPTLTGMAVIGLRPAVFYFAARLIDAHARAGSPDPVAAAQEVLAAHRCRLTDDHVDYLAIHNRLPAGQLALFAEAAA